MKHRKIIKLTLFCGVVWSPIKLTKAFYLQAGQGYSSYTEDIASAICFIPDKVTVTESNSIVKYDSGLSTESLYKELGLEAHFEYNYKFSAEATLGYLKTIEENTLSFSVSYVNKIWRTLSFDYPFQVDEHLTEDGKRIYNYGPTEFITYCGNHYISSYQEGAMLIYTLKFNFMDRTEKEKFKAEASFSLGSLFGASSSVEKITNKTKASGNLEIKAYQVGGDPRKLSSALVKESASCPFKDLSACKTVLESLIEYSKVFPDQVDIQNEALGTMKMLGPYTISPHPFITEQIDLSEATPIAPEVLASRSLIKRIYEFYELNSDNLNRIKDEGFLPYAPGLMKNLANVEQNLSLMLTGLWHGPMSGCWYDYEYCEDILNEIREHLQIFDFNPDDIKVCNHPNELNISPVNLCQKAHSRYNGPAYYTEDGSWTDIQLPEEDGKCYASAKAIFLEKKKWYRRIGGSKWKRVEKDCGDVVYSPEPDPTPSPPGRWLSGYEDILDYIP